MIFVQDSLGAQEADTVQHVISAAGAPQDTFCLLYTSDAADEL